MKLYRSLIPGNPDLWIPPGVDIDNLPEITNQEAAVKALRNSQQTFIVHEGTEKQGQPFCQLSWQWLTTWQIFGQLRPDGTRQYQRVFIMIPKKSGKSPYLGWLAWYLCAFDGEAGALVAVIASSVKQAGHIYKPIAFNVAHHPLQREDPRFKEFKSTLTIEYYGPMYPGGPVVKRGTIERETGDSKGASGGNYSALIFDEIHELKGPRGRELYLVYTTESQIFRPNPLIVTATTAGIYEQGSIYETLKDEAMAVLENPELNPRMLVVAYIPDTEEEKWLRDGNFPSDDLIRKLNPQCDELIPFDRIKEKLLESFNNPDPSVWQHTLCRRFNLDISQIQSWMPQHLWKACDFGPVDLESMEGRRCFLGFDIGGVDDMTALVAIFPPESEGEKLQIWAKAYLCELKVQKHAGEKAKEDGETVRMDVANYRQWEKDGWLEVTPGRVSDTDKILEDILRICGMCEVAGIGYDPRDALKIVNRIEEEYPVCVSLVNSAAIFNAPMTEFMKDVVREAVNHGGNPALSWCVCNLSVKISKTEIMPWKDSRSQRIDLAMAMLNAYACYHADTGDKYGDVGVYSV